MLYNDSLLITRYTLMIQSAFCGGYKSIITTTHGVFRSSLSVNQLLNLACIRHASTLEGRMEATKKMMNYANKSPILIAEKIGAFPTRSYKDLECIWIFNHLFQIENQGRGLCKLTFYDKISVEVAVSKYTLLKQQERLHTTMNLFSMLSEKVDLFDLKFPNKM
nr:MULTISPECIES: competence protein ComK [unclassified Psychrobacillus]